MSWRSEGFYAADMMEPRRLDRRQLGRRAPADRRYLSMVYGTSDVVWHCDVCQADVPRDQLHRGPATCMTMCRDCGEL